MTYRNYQHYLISEKWRQVRNDYISFNYRVSSHCLFCCSETKLNFHHWTYPKDWNKDSHENIILVCEECHMKLHDSKHGSNNKSFKEYMGYAMDRIFKSEDSHNWFYKKEETYEDEIFMHKLKEY